MKNTFSESRLQLFRGPLPVTVMLAIFSLHQAAPKGLLFVQEGPDSCGSWQRAVTEPSPSRHKGEACTRRLNSLLNSKLMHPKRLLFVKKLTSGKASPQTELSTSL